MKQATMKQAALRFPPWLEEWASEYVEQRLPESAELSNLFWKLVEGSPERLLIPREMRPLLQDIWESFSDTLWENMETRSNFEEKQPSPEEIQELLEVLERALALRRKDAVKLLVEHGAMAPREFAETLYVDSPTWRRHDNLAEAKRLLRDVVRRGLVKRCRNVPRYYASEEGKRLLREN